jgi:anti-sigma B factor antagonist
MPLTLNVEERNGRQVLKAAGEVDLYSSPQLRDALLRMIEKAAGDCAVDLQDVPYMDSSGVATLVEGLKAAHQRKQEFYVLSPSPPVMKVLQLSRLDTVFNVEEQAGS